MRHLTLSLLGLLGLASCATGENDDPLIRDIAEDDSVIDPVEYTLQWDDPTFMPEVDRWAPENMLLVDVPLGTSIITDVDEYRFFGQSSQDRLGIGVAAGRYYGSVRDDILIGSIFASGTGSGDGAAYVWRSKSNGAADTGKDIRADAALVKVYGTNTEKAGERVHSGYDHNNDGIEDMLLGARNHTHVTDTWKTNSGGVYVYNGTTKGKITAPTDGIMVEGDKAFDYLGAGAAFIPDRNGDGFDDLILGATGGDGIGSGSGLIYLVNGPVTSGNIGDIADATISGENTGDGAGARAEDAGDIDGDGTNDIIVGVRGQDNNGTNAGAAYLITATTYPSNLNDADWILRGNTTNSGGGNAVAALGDINNDGLDDFGVGSLTHNGLGYAYVVYGTTGTMTDGTLGSVADIRLYGQTSGDQFGSFIFAGDFDQDGDQDLGVSANRQSGNDRGAVYFFLDPATGTIPAYTADAKVVGAGSGDYLGSWVAIAENTDFAGTEKVIIGASGRGSDDKGAVYLLEY